MLGRGDIYQLINFASFSRWLFIAMATLGMLIHRYRFPEYPRPFKVATSAIPLNCFFFFCQCLMPVHIYSPNLVVTIETHMYNRFFCFCLEKVPWVIAVIFTVVCFFIVGLSLYSDPWNTGGSCALTLSGVPVYYLTVKRQHLPHRLRRAFSESSSCPPPCLLSQVVI